MNFKGVLGMEMKEEEANIIIKEEDNHLKRVVEIDSSKFIILLSLGLFYHHS